SFPPTTPAPAWNPTDTARLVGRSEMLPVGLLRFPLALIVLPEPLKPLSRDAGSTISMTEHLGEPVRPRTSSGSGSPPTATAGATSVVTTGSGAGAGAGAGGLLTLRAAGQKLGVRRSDRGSARRFRWAQCGGSGVRRSGHGCAHPYRWSPWATIGGLGPRGPPEGRSQGTPFPDGRRVRRRSAAGQGGTPPGRRPTPRGSPGCAEWRRPQSRGREREPATQPPTWRPPSQWPRRRHIGNDRQGRDSKYLGGGDPGRHRRLR